MSKKVNAGLTISPFKFVTLRSTDGSTDRTANLKGDFIMNKNLTEIVFILDRSGSMAGLESDTIGGFNSMVEKQKARNRKQHRVMQFCLLYCSAMTIRSSMTAPIYGR